MREFLKTLAAICAVLFIMTGVPVLLLFNIESRAFSSSTYKQAFTDLMLYERMPGILANTLSSTISQNPNMVPFLRELTVEEWQAMISTLLPPEELRAMTDQTLDSTFDYLNFRSNSVNISLLPVKAKLAGEPGVVVVRQFLQTQPACTVEQLTQMALGLLGGDIALCNPPDEALNLLAPFIQSQLRTINATFPNEIALIPGWESGTPQDPRLQLQAIRSAVRLSPFFILLLLLTVAVLAVRSLREMLIWWGWPLLLTGMAAAVIATIGSPIVGWFLQLLILSQGAILLPPILASSIGETATAVAGQMLVPAILQGLIITGIGLIMVVLGIFLGRRKRYIITYT